MASELDLSLKPDAGGFEAWLALARKTLGEAAQDALGTRADWPRGDASGLPGASPFTRGASADRSPRWDVRTIIANPDPAAANAEILEDLAGGATSISLRIADARGPGIPVQSAADLARVLEGVDLGKVAIALDARTAPLPTGRLLLSHAKSGKGARLFLNHDVFAMLASRGGVPGSIASEIKAAASLARDVADFASVRTVGIDTRAYHNAGATPAQELAAALASGAAYLRALTKAGLDVAAAARQIAFILVTDANFLSSIAKLRAFRRVWARVLSACGASAATASLHVTAVASELMLCARDPYVNILRGTVAAFAGALGGADAIALHPFTDRLGLPSAHARRIARNTQVILLEESNLARVIDPAGGAFALERASEDLAQNAWRQFQEIEAKGGMAEALTGGFLRSKIEAAWAERRARIAERREWITGVSDYPLLAETTPALAPSPKPSARKAAGPALTPVMEPLAAHHLDDAFDALRAASDRHLAATGARPKIYLVCIGAEVDYAPRAVFARALFESGGIEAIVGATGLDAETAAAKFLDSGIPMAALCSSDAIYSEHALAFAHEVKRAGARYLYFVGASGDLELALSEAGVDAFVGEGVDAIATLTRAHEILGIEA